MTKAKPKANRDAQRERILAGLYELAVSAESESVRATASVAWLDRVDGKPGTAPVPDVDRQVTVYVQKFSDKFNPMGGDVVIAGADAGLL